MTIIKHTAYTRKHCISTHVPPSFLCFPSLLFILLSLPLLVCLLYFLSSFLPPSLSLRPSPLPPSPSLSFPSLSLPPSLSPSLSVPLFSLPLSPSLSFPSLSLAPSLAPSLSLPPSLSFAPSLSLCPSLPPSHLLISSSDRVLFTSCSSSVLYSPVSAQYSSSSCRSLGYRNALGERNHNKFNACARKYERNSTQQKCDI